MDSLQPIITFIKTRAGMGQDGGPLQWLLLVILVLAVLLVLLLAGALLVRQLRKLWQKLFKVARPDSVKALCGCDPVSAPAIAPPGWLERLGMALDYLRTRREWRYASPWILLLGEAGAGKSSLLASLSAQHRQPLSGRQQQLEIEGTQWHSVQNGFLIDPQGQWPYFAAAPQESEAAAAATKTWRRILHRLDALRPERALDGIILLVSARSLQTASLAERHILAENARRQLQTIEQRFEFALPVYIVISACDSVAGFAAFWRSQGVQRRQEMIGWSAPAQSNEAPPAAWAQALFQQLDTQLTVLQVEVAARNAQEAIAADDIDAFFLFPRQLQKLHAPFADWLAIVFQATPWQAGFFCRGVYLTGVVAAHGAQPVPRDTVRRDIAFVSDLILQKVLAESNLGRPTRSGVWSRNGLIRRLQMGVVAGFGLLLAGFGMALWQADKQIEQVTVALKSMQQLQPGARNSRDCIGQEAVFQLLQHIANIDADGTRWALPLSWFDRRLERKSAQRIANQAFKDVILPALACQLTQRANELNNASVARLAEDAQYHQAHAALLDYVQQLTLLEQNAARFERLVGRSPFAKNQTPLPEFIELVQTLYRTHLPATVKHHHSVLPAALGAINVSHAGQSVVIPPTLKHNASAHIEVLATQVRVSFHSELQAGTSALAKLEQKQQPLLANIKQFTQWLGWVRKSWLGSSSTNNPLLQIQTGLADKLQPLIALYGYPAAPLKRASSQFDAARRYPQAMKTLNTMQIPGYGALFITLDQEIGINPALLAQLAGLEALQAQPFMQATPLQHFRCQGNIANWSVQYLNQAQQNAKEYQGFLASPLLKNVAAGSMAQQLARYQLDLVLGHSLQQAQAAALAAASTTLGNQQTGSAELRLSQDTTNFNKLLPVLANVQQTYRELGLDLSLQRLNQCLSQYANENLAQVALLATQSQLYQPGPSTSGRGTNEHFFDLGNTPVLKDYLARQLGRVQVLSGYASPYLEVLNQTGSGTSAASASGNPAATPVYWRNTQNELKAATQAQDPNGQVSLLDNLFLKQLPELTWGNCSKNLAASNPPAPGNDLFSAHRQQLEKQVQLQCKGERNANAQVLYVALASRFNRELAGRFPFASLDAVDADLATVRHFFNDYQAQRSTLSAALAGLNGPYWQNARQFLRLLDCVIRFFSGNLVPPESTPGSDVSDAGSAVSGIKLNVNFRAQAANAQGGEQIATWSLSSGNKTISYPNRGTVLDWQFGQPLVLDMAWASHSQWRPVITGVAGVNPDMQVEGSNASFAATGNWALLRMIARHVPKAGNQFDALDPGRVLLEFNVPLINTSAPGKAATGNATLYVSYKLTSTGAKANALKLPAAFPNVAPQ